jgi:hypothetical protein
MQIPGYGPKVSIIFDQLAFESTLEQMTGALMPFGVRVCITAQQILHSTRKVGERCAKMQVDVVRHPNKGENLPRCTQDSLFQSVQHSPIIVIRVEQALPTIATGHDVVNRAFELDSERSRHSVNLAICRIPENRV